MNMRNVSGTPQTVIDLLYLTQIFYQLKINCNTGATLSLFGLNNKTSSVCKLNVHGTRSSLYYI